MGLEATTARNDISLGSDARDGEHLLVLHAAWGHAYEEPLSLHQSPHVAHIHSPHGPWRAVASLSASLMERDNSRASSRNPNAEASRARVSAGAPSSCHCAQSAVTQHRHDRPPSGITSLRIGAAPYAGPFTKTASVTINECRPIWPHRRKDLPGCAQESGTTSHCLGCVGFGWWGVWWVGGLECARVGGVAGTLTSKSNFVNAKLCRNLWTTQDRRHPNNPSGLVLAQPASSPNTLPIGLSLVQSRARKRPACKDSVSLGSDSEGARSNRRGGREVPGCTNQQHAQVRGGGTSF